MRAFNHGHIDVRKHARIRKGPPLIGIYRRDENAPAWLKVASARGRRWPQRRSGSRGARPIPRAVVFRCRMCECVWRCVCVCGGEGSKGKGDGEREGVCCFMCRMCVAHKRPSYPSTTGIHIPAPWRAAPSQSPPAPRRPGPLISVPPARPPPGPPARGRGGCLCVHVSPCMHACSRT